MYKNQINFNCQKFIEISPVQPKHCYNCCNRDGYPYNLGGDKECNNFKLYDRKPTNNIKKLKSEVWDLFSEYVRRSEANEQGFVQCVTCKKWLPWKEAQAGHYIHGTLFSIPEIVHSQCPQCNGFLHGNLINYKEYMLEKYGQKNIDRFEFLAKRQVKYSLFDLQQLKKFYIGKLRELK